MFYYRTYLDKCATIINGSDCNTGFNPVSDLLYGRNNSRMLIHFPHEKIKKMVEDNMFPNKEKFKHYLRIKNASSIDMSELHKIYGSQIDGLSKKRASSFDLIFFMIPKHWDNGKGYDYTNNYLNTAFYDKIDYDYVSNDGVTWFNATNINSWKDNIEYQKTNVEQLSFYIKSDKNVISSNGDSVLFTYTLSCNGFEQLQNIQFKCKSNYADAPIEIGDIFYYSKGGYVCHTEEDILKYAKYASVLVKFSENKTQNKRKYSFILETEINGNKYTSNPYRIIQNTYEEYVYPQTDNGIYSTNTLNDQLILFENNQDSIIIAKQHFDIGIEDINVDITETFNKIIEGEIENYGICIAFSPEYELEKSAYENYVGLLTNRTNSFFEPYVESIYYESIEDDRANFILDKKNRLYFYANIGGNLVNLDELPICTINDTEYEVKQGGKGIYYIELSIPSSLYTSPTMLYDKWSNIKYNGNDINDVELEFTTQSQYTYFKMGSNLPEKQNFTPTIYGISEGEDIKPYDVRKVCFLFKKEYSKNVAVYVDDIEVRLYVMDGTAQVTVIPYIKTERAFGEVYLLIDTSILIPNTYHMDVRVKYGMEMVEHHNILTFNIVNDENNKYV